jgi:ribosomal protein S16
MQAAPFYRMFVADARAPRDGKHIDVVGHFDPIPGIACGRSDQCIFRLSLYDKRRLFL